MNRRLACLVYAIVAGWTATASAMVIQLDYTHDTFISLNATAKAALEAAANDISNAIASTLVPITAGDEVIHGVDGTFTTSMDWKFTYTDPTTQATVTLDPPLAPADTVTIFVGARKFSGTTLGAGGPGGAGISVSATGFDGADFPGSVANAEAQSNAIYTRGSGPIIGNLSGSLSLGESNIPYSLDYGLAIGKIAFDTEADWHYDHTAAVVADMHDFYSVALHELLHAIGFGASDSWNTLQSGTNWAGPNAIALHGTGVGLVTGGHINPGTTSTRISDGQPQEAAMDPNLMIGTRKELTNLDLAFLTDIGWAIPEPGTALLVLFGLLAGSRRRAA